MKEAVILEAVRTPYGKRGGAYRDTRPDALLAHALRGLVDRAGLDAGKIEDVITGTVTQTGEQGANIGRLAVLLAGFPAEVPAVTLNRMCGSGQQAIHFAAQGITAGDITYAVGCGVESMTRVQMFSDIGGGFERLNPDLLAQVDLIHQGESAERIAEHWGLTREVLDAFSAESHRRAAEAHAVYMAAQGWSAHEEPHPDAPEFYGRVLIDRLVRAWKESGGEFEGMGMENAAMGFATAQDVVLAWLRSPSHCEALMDAQVAYVGVGHAGEGLTNIWVQNFSDN